VTEVEDAGPWSQKELKGHGRQSPRDKKIMTKTEKHKVGVGENQAAGTPKVRPADLAKKRGDQRKGDKDGKREKSGKGFGGIRHMREKSRSRRRLRTEKEARVLSLENPRTARHGQEVCCNRLDMNQAKEEAGSVPATKTAWSGWRTW